MQIEEIKQQNAEKRKDARKLAKIFLTDKRLRMERLKQMKSNQYSRSEISNSSEGAAVAEPLVRESIRELVTKKSGGLQNKPD